MAQVIWSPQAVEDLRAICEYIARDSEQLAILTATKILVATDQLEDFPLSGRVVPEREREGLRELVVGSHRVVYRIDGEDVSILCVIHGRQQFPAGVRESTLEYVVRRTLKEHLLAIPDVGLDSDFARPLDLGRDPWRPE